MLTYPHYLHHHYRWFEPNPDLALALALRLEGSHRRQHGDQG